MNNADKNDIKPDEQVNVNHFIKDNIRSRVMTYYPITKEELEDLYRASSNSTYYSMLSGIAGSAFVSFLAMLLTGCHTNPTILAVFVGITIGSLIGFLLCIFNWKQADKFSLKLKKRFFR